MENTNPLVSIIVRTKDRPKLLRRALKSIAAQTYRPIAVILVNDGGCDLPVEELKDLLGDIFLNYIRLEKNRGRAAAGNVGIENAIGEYIGFLDDDDEFYPEHVEILISFLEQSDYRIAYTDAKMVYGDFNPEERRIVNVDKTVLFSKDFSYNELLVGNYIPFMCLLFKREVLTDSDGFDSSFDLYEDWEFLIRIAKRFTFYHIKKTTAIYNQWDKDLQINQKDSEYMKKMHLNVINKHHGQIPSEFILHIWQELERKDAVIAEKDAVIAEANTIIAEANTIIAEADAIIAEADAIIAEVDAIEAKDPGAGKSDLIPHLKDVLSAKDNEISRLEKTIEQMKGTLGWQFLEKYRRVREKIWSVGTMRRKIYDLVMKSIKTVTSEGYRIFFKKLKAKIKARFFGSNISAKVSDFEDTRHFITPRKFRVLFLISPWAGVTNRYRAYNMKEYLGLVGIESEIVGIEDVDTKISRAFGFDVIVIHRIPMNELLKAFIKKCKELCIPVIFDLDDYIFDTSLVQRIDEIKRMSSNDRNKWVQHVRGCRETLDASDYFIGPTSYLVKKVEDFSKKAFVIRNGLNRTQIIESDKAFMKVKRDDSLIKIGYFSGTKTHQKDFEVVSPALLKIMSEHENVHLCVGGFLELRYSFNEFSQRIERIPYVDWKKLPFNIARVDINIAPLEPDNPFCEAKSELKFFEAALLRIPTVASPSDAYRYAIKDGENGLLATTEEEWYTCLKSLIENSVIRKTLGEKAYETVMKIYAPHAQAKKTLEVYKNIIIDYRRKRGISDENLSISFIFSSLKNRGNFSRMLFLARSLAERGHMIKVYHNSSIDAGEGLEKIKSFQHFNPRFSVIGSTSNIFSCDVLIAGNRESLTIASKSMDKCCRIFYMNDEKADSVENRFLCLNIPESNKEIESLETFLMDELSIGNFQ